MNRFAFCLITFLFICSCLDSNNRNPETKEITQVDSLQHFIKLHLEKYPDEDAKKYLLEIEQEEYDGYRMMAYYFSNVNKFPHNYREPAFIYWLEKGAEVNNIGCILDLGYHYNNEGKTTLATDYFEKAAALNSSEGKKMLGSIYNEQSNYERAKDHLQASSEQNNPDAIYELGKMHFYGEGYEQSYKEAFPLLLKAAELDNDYGDIVADMYYHGLGIEQDGVVA